MRGIGVGQRKNRTSQSFRIWQEDLALHGRLCLIWQTVVNGVSDPGDKARKSAMPVTRGGGHARLGDAAELDMPLGVHPAAAFPRSASIASTTTSIACTSMRTSTAPS